MLTISILTSLLLFTPQEFINLYTYSQSLQGRTHMTQDIQSKVAQAKSTYDVYLEIDCDCEELLDAIGLDYTRSEDDDTQNEVCISLNKDEFKQVVWDISHSWTLDGRLPDEQDIGSVILNHELGEYTTKVTVYAPTGDKITFE